MSWKTEMETLVRSLEARATACQKSMDEYPADDVINRRRLMDKAAAYDHSAELLRQQIAQCWNWYGDGAA